jgi:hypothetical protein
MSEVEGILYEVQVHDLPSVNIKRKEIWIPSKEIIISLGCHANKLLVWKSSEKGISVGNEKSIMLPYGLVNDFDKIIEFRNFEKVVESTIEQYFI